MKVRRIGIRLVAAGLLALSLASCDLFGARGPIRIAAIGPLNPAANPINGELSTTNAALLEATSQGLVSYDGGGEIDVGLAERWTVTGDGRSRSEEHTSELQSLMRISYAVFCLK